VSPPLTWSGASVHHGDDRMVCWRPVARDNISFATTEISPRTRRTAELPYLVPPQHLGCELFPAATLVPEGYAVVEVCGLHFLHVRPSHQPSPGNIPSYYGWYASPQGMAEPDTGSRRTDVASHACAPSNKQNCEMADGKAYSAEGASPNRMGRGAGEPRISHSKGSLEASTSKNGAQAQGHGPGTDR
jgi:hypothetical protein